jgi:hypothetical protein
MNPYVTDIFSRTARHRAGRHYAAISGRNELDAAIDLLHEARRLDAMASALPFAAGAEHPEYLRLRGEADWIRTAARSLLYTHQTGRVSPDLHGHLPL